MVLITGGAWQGKLSFALELAEGQCRDSGKNGDKNRDIADGSSDAYEAAFQRKIIYGLHEYIRRLLKEDRSVEEFLTGIRNNNPHVLLVTNEIGCGIVPVDKEERRWREAAGRAAVWAAKDSEAVYRLVCGIPTRIK